MLIFKPNLTAAKTPVRISGPFVSNAIAIGRKFSGVPVNFSATRTLSILC
jgi:hypothetical protein